MCLCDNKSKAPIRLVQSQILQGFSENNMFLKNIFAEESAEINRKMVEGKDVVLESDETSKDRFGRKLAYIYLVGSSSSPAGQVFVNAKLAEEGAVFSVAYPPDTKYQEEIAAAEKSALDKKLGLWGACGFSAEKRPISD